MRTSTSRVTGTSKRTAPRTGMISICGWFMVFSLGARVAFPLCRTFGEAAGAAYKNVEARKTTMAAPVGFSRGLSVPSRQVCNQQRIPLAMPFDDCLRCVLRVLKAVKFALSEAKGLNELHATVWRIDR